MKKELDPVEEGRVMIYKLALEIKTRIWMCLVIWTFLEFALRRPNELRGLIERLIAILR